MEENKTEQKKEEARSEALNIQVLIIRGFLSAIWRAITLHVGL